MNQTRVFLIFAWLMVATLLWFEWSRDKAAPAQPAVAAQTAAAQTDIPFTAALLDDAMGVSGCSKRRNQERIQTRSESRLCAPSGRFQDGPGF